MGVGANPHISHIPHSPHTCDQAFRCDRAIACILTKGFDSHMACDRLACVITQNPENSELGSPNSDIIQVPHQVGGSKRI